MENPKLPGIDGEIFRSLSPMTLEKLNKIREIKEYEKGDSLFYEGKSPTGIYSIHQGCVKIFKNGKDGNNRIIYISKPGDLIGWEQLTESHYTKDAVALEEVIVSCFPLVDFLAIAKEESELSLELTKYLCKGHLILESKVFQESLQQRLATNLLQLMEKFGRSYENKTLLNVPLSKMDIASLIGTNPETIIKLLSKFKKDGIIDFVDKRMLILNPAVLRKMSNY